MVDADAVVLLPGARLIIPEGVDAVRLGGGADRVGKAEVGQRPEARPRLRKKEGIAHPELGIEHVDLGRNDVVIPGEDQRFFKLHPFT